MLYLKQHYKNSQIAKICQKIKMPKFRTKMPYLGLFEREFSQTIVIFEINTLKFVNLQNFPKKNKSLKFGTKNGLFWYFWARILKNLCHIWNSTVKFVKLQNFLKKQKCLSFRKKRLICVFFGRNFKKLLSNFKSAPSILSNCKVLRENTNSKIWN